MCRLFGHSVQKNIESANQLINKCKDHRKTAEPILSIMPETFSLKQFKEIREKNGQNTNVRAILHHYVKCGKLERLDRGMYRKMSNVKV